MATTNAGTILQGKALEDAEATGFSNPSVTTFSDEQYIWSKTFNVAKSGVEDSTPATTYEAIRAACASEHVTDSADFLNTNTVTTYGDVTSIVLVSDPKFGDTAPVYQCTMNFYVKVA